MSDGKFKLLKYVDDVVTTKDARIADLEQQLAEAKREIERLRSVISAALWLIE